MIDGHGDDLYHFDRLPSVNFSSNVYPFADRTGLDEHLRRVLSSVISNYPEPTPRRLEVRLAEVHGVSPEAVCVTAGSTQAIYLTASAFEGGTAFVAQPTFSEYADACRMHGHRVVNVYHPWASDGPWAIGEGLFFLCNPNNPTGGVMSREEVLRLVDDHPRTIFVVDQSYEAFTLHALPTPRDAEVRDNLILLHSMTKRYALPGLRLGYLTGCPALVEEVRRRRMPWAVNALAMEAGLYIADHVSSAKLPNLSAYLQETSRLRDLLLSTGVVDVWPTDVHFMLCRLRMGRASALKDHLMRTYGMLIRDASNFEGLDAGFFRVATGRPEHNDQLSGAILRWAMNDE